MPRLSPILWPPLKPGASDMVAIAGGLLAFATVAGGALPVLPPSLAMTLPAPAGCACLGDGSVSFVILRLASVACVSSGPKGSTMPRASCRIGEEILRYQTACPTSCCATQAGLEHRNTRHCYHNWRSSLALISLLMKKLSWLTVCWTGCPHVTGPCLARSAQKMSHECGNGPPGWDL